MKPWIALALSLTALCATPALADDPTARRVMILCADEDPSCRPVFTSLYRQAMADPIWRHHDGNPYGVRFLCPEQHQRPANHPLTMQEVWFQFVGVASSGMLEYSASYVMQEALQEIMPCSG